MAVPWGICGPPDGGHGGVCSRRGLVQRDAPPIFFSVLADKKTGRARSKRKGRLGALRCSGPPRDGGRRIGACSDFAWPSGTLFSSAGAILPSRGRWCGGGRGGHRIEFLLFSLPLAVPRGSWYNGPMRASAPTGRRKAFGPVWYEPPRPPGQRVAKRNARKEELVKCVLAPR